MPAAIPAVVAAASAYASGATIFGLSAALSATLIGIGSFALNTIGAALAPKPKRQNFGDLSSSRTQQVKQPVTERRVIFGECKTSGVITYFGSTADNKFLHIVLTLATHQCNQLGTTWFNDDPIHMDDLDSGGNVTSGKFAGKARIKKHLGQSGQVVDPDLLAEISEITSDFVGNEQTYIAVRLEKDDALYKTGMPNIQQWVQGALVEDTRTSTTYWSPNTVLCIRHYMMRTRFYGLRVPSTKFTATNVNANANTCDEMVATVAVPHNVTAVSASGNTLTLDGDQLKFQTGDRVQITTTDTPPAGLSLLTNYYVIVWQMVGTVKIKLATSYANALAGTAIDITDAGVGTHMVTKNAEPRYTCNGTIGTSMTPRDILNQMLTSMAGDLIPVGGKWIFKAGAWVEPTIELDLDDCLGTIEVQTKHPSRERFNGVQGLYVNPINFGEPTDYPLVTDDTYLTEDNTDDPDVAQFDQPFTSRTQHAQRVGRIQLNRHRRQRTLTFTTNMAGMQLQAGSTFMFTYGAHAYSGKKFEVAEWSLVPRKFGKYMALTCDIVANETDSEIYDFDESTEEITPSRPQAVAVADPDNVTPPGAPVVVEVKYTTTDGTGVKVRADVTFAASTDFFVREYQIRWRAVGATEWNVQPPSNQTTQSIFDIAPGTYEVGITAISIFDARSDPDDAYSTFTIIGLTDLPIDVEGFSVVSMDADCTFAWDKATDLDVLVAGHVRIRHTPDLISYNWGDARDIVPQLSGTTTQANAPLLPGVYMAKFVDSVGNESANAAIIIVADTKAINLNAKQTITEETTFTGTKTNMIAIDSVLRLDGVGLFDSASGSFDDAEGLFDAGDGNNNQVTGEYTFATKGDLTAVTKAYVASHIACSIYNSNDLFDLRSGNFDDALGLFDGSAVPGIEIKFWVRTTDNDPNGMSPTWSEWMPFVAGYFTARGFEFKVTVASADGIYQIDIEELGASLDIPDIVETGTVTTLAGSLQTFNFTKTYTSAPNVVPVINDAQAGDLLVYPVASTTTSQWQAGVLNSGSYVIRTLTYYARGQ